MSKSKTLVAGRTSALLAAWLFAGTAGAAADSQPVAGGSSEPETTRTRVKHLAEASPLHYALFRKQYDAALAAMPLAEDIDALDPVYGQTPLGMAAMDESASAYEMVRPLLVVYGADPDVTDKQGFTALHYAARAGNYAVAELLLEFGADVDAENPLHADMWITPLWMAYQKNRTRLADFLKRRGARELAPGVRERLQLDAEMSEAVSNAAERVSRLPESPDPELDLRRRFEVMSGATERTLRRQGRTEELEAWLATKGQVFRAMQETPPPGADRSAGRYAQEVTANILRAMRSPRK